MGTIQDRLKRIAKELEGLTNDLEEYEAFTELEKWEFLRIYAELRWALAGLNHAIEMFDRKQHHEESKEQD